MLTSSLMFVFEMGIKIDTKLALAVSVIVFAVVILGGLQFIDL